MAAAAALRAFKFPPPRNLCWIKVWERWEDMKGYARDRVIRLSVFISRYGDLYLVYPFFIYFIFYDMNDVPE